MIIGIGIVVGIVQLIRTKSRFAQLITAGYLIAVISPMISGKVWASVGFFSLAISSILALVYGLKGYGLTGIKKAVISLPAFVLFIMFLFQFQNWPGSGFIGLSMIIPVLALALVAFRKFENYKDELGFVTISAAIALCHFLLTFNLITK